MWTVPAVAPASPQITRSRVDFPAPLSPKMAYTRPGWKLAVTSRKAAKRPKILLTFSRLMGGAGSARSGLASLGSAAASVGRIGRTILGALCRRCGCSRLLVLGRVLGGALGLQHLGVEDAVVPVAALGQRLGVVHEGVGRRLGAVINHGQHQVLLDERELHMRALALDRARRHVAGHPQALGVDAGIHRAQLLDGHVVALALLHPGERQVGQPEDDDPDSHAKLHVFVVHPRHTRKTLVLSLVPVKAGSWPR